MNNNHSYSIIYNKIGSEPRFHTQKNVCVKVVIINNLEQKQKFALIVENTTDLPKTLQVPSLCCFS